MTALSGGSSRPTTAPLESYGSSDGGAVERPLEIASPRRNWAAWPLVLSGALVAIALGAARVARPLRADAQGATAGSSSPAPPRAITLADLPPPKTESSEALAHYLTAMRDLHDATAQAQTQFGAAARIDPSFAAAKLRLAWCSRGCLGRERRWGRPCASARRSTHGTRHCCTPRSRTSSPSPPTGPRPSDGWPPLHEQEAERRPEILLWLAQAQKADHPDRFQGEPHPGARAGSDAGDRGEPPRLAGRGRGRVGRGPGPLSPVHRHHSPIAAGC